MNEEQIIIMIVSAILNGTMLALGMVLGTRLTARTMRKEVDDVIEKSPTLKVLTTFLKNANKMFEEDKVNELIGKVTKFFDDAGELVSSPDAKNFFKNATVALKDFSSEPEVKLKLPEKTKKKVKKSG